MIRSCPDSVMWLSAQAIEDVQVGTRVVAPPRLLKWC
jgi:hypothetical protein